MLQPEFRPTLRAMLPANPFLQFVPDRVQNAVDRVERLIWQPVQSLPAAATAASPNYVDFATARRRPRRPVRAGEHWGRLFDQRWVRVPLPRRAGRELFLHWRDQGEATAYIDGVPYYGFDVAHRYAPLPAGAREVWLECLCCQSAIWHPAATGLDAAGSRCDGARLVARDEQAWRVYHDLVVLNELLREEHKANLPARRFADVGSRTLAPVEYVSVLYRRLARRLDEAVDAFDCEGLAALERELRRIYREFRADAIAPAAVLAGQTHIDLVWLWPERVGELKAVHTFATVDRLMARYPDFRFFYSQTASYRAVGRRAPALLRRVRARIREKRWEATGALEVESDTILPCGEALARSFLLGQAEFARLRGGSPARVLWLPDVFGYSACLPQLMRQTGAEYFFTTKLIWNQLHRFPHTSFVWRGNDGSEVIAHLTGEYGYNGVAAVAELKAHLLAHRQSDVHPEFLVPTGYGDGGGGPTESMCERANRLADLASLPRARWGGVEPFFDRLARRRDRLPTWQGEFYLEAHRSSYTSHGRVKLAYRTLERALQTAEAAACATGGGPVDAHAWRRLVFAQFHDFLPGSSIPDVYREGLAEQAKLTAAALDTAAKRLDRAGGAPCVFNPLPYPRAEWVRVGRRRRLVHLPPLAGVRIGADEAAPSEVVPPVRVAGRTLDNGLLRARFDAQGRLRGLRVDGRDVALAGPAGALWIYPDHPHMFEPWEIDRQTLALGRPLGRPESVRVEADDGTEGTLLVTHRIGTRSTLAVRFALRGGERVLRITVEADWHEPERLVKMVFPTRHAGRWARYGSPFNSILRGQQAGSTTDEAMWEAPGSRWIAVADEGERDGLAVITEAKFGFSCRDGTVGATLLRSCVIAGLDYRHAPTYPPGLVRETSARHADLGRHTMQLAVGRYDANAPREQQPAALADTLFTSPVEYRGRPVDAGFTGLDGGDTLQPCWAKPLGRGRWLLRLHETHGRRGETRVRLTPGWTARRTDLSEKPGATLRGGRLTFRPYEIVSVLVEKARKRGAAGA
jgi:alpha-mannosidase